MTLSTPSIRLTRTIGTSFLVVVQRSQVRLRNRLAAARRRDEGDEYRCVVFNDAFEREMNRALHEG